MRQRIWSYMRERIWSYMRERPQWRNWFRTTPPSPFSSGHPREIKGDAVDNCFQSYNFIVHSGRLLNDGLFEVQLLCGKLCGGIGLLSFCVSGRASSIVILNGGEGETSFDCWVALMRPKRGLIFSANLISFYCPPEGIVSRRWLRFGKGGRER